MKIKLRVALSVIIAFAVMGPTIFTSPGKVEAILIFTSIAFITIFILLSLFNIKNLKMKIAFLSISALILAYKLYVYYFVTHWIFSKALVASLVFTSLFVMIFRGVSLLIEKDQEEK